MSHHHPRRRGRHRRCPRAFAVIFALFLIALVGAALLALTSLMTSDARRSTRGAVDAQLRQLLHAGAVAAAQRLRDGGGAFPQRSFEGALPAALRDAPATVRIVPEPLAQDGLVVVTIEAQLADRGARQRIVFERIDAGWAARSVEMR